MIVVLPSVLAFSAIRSEGGIVAGGDYIHGGKLHNLGVRGEVIFLFLNIHFSLLSIEVVDSGKVVEV